MRRARAFGCDKSISSKPKSAPIKRIRHRRGGLVAPSNVTGALPRARQRTDGAGADPAARPVRVAHAALVPNCFTEARVRSVSI